MESQERLPGALADVPSHSHSLSMQLTASRLLVPVLCLALAPEATAQRRFPAPTPSRPLAGACESTVDLRLWSAESYPAVSGFGAGSWTPAPDGSTVTQSVNGQPTFFVSDFDVAGSTFQGRIQVSGGDDDLIGFALGFEPGDVTNPAAEYLLIDWKGGTQGFDFGDPSCSAGTTSPAGLAVSRVFGIPTADEFWGHTNSDDPCSDLSNGLEELQRGATLGATGWSANSTYDFRFELGPTNLKVYVDGMLELDVDGTFPSGRAAFYNFSQAGVTYSAFSTGALASWVEYGAGWPGTMGVPGLALSAPPVLGTGVTLLVGNSAGTPQDACLLFSTTPANVPTRWGGSLLVGSPFALVLALHPLPAAGTTVPLQVPADPAMCGAKGYFQVFQKDPGASRGIAFTRGIEATLGD